MAHIKVEKLIKVYEVTRTETQEVLRGLNAEFSQGEFIAILGESGCGKSTLLNILAGLDFDYDGTVEFDGEDLQGFTEKQADDYRKYKIGIIFQSYHLVGHMTAIENVAVPLALCGWQKNERLKKAEELLERVGLKEHARKYPSQMSGGQKQRVAIARALVNNPTFILADEPTGNLDKEAAEDILDLLKQIALDGKTVICVTHSNHVASECTRVIHLDDGIVKSDEQNAKGNKPIEETQSINSDEQTHAKPQIKAAELVKMAVRNVRQSKKRNFMVILALSIGIAAFVLIMALSAGMRGYVTNEIGVKMNRLQIDVTKDTNSVETFTQTDIDNIASISGVARVIPTAEVVLSARYRLDGGDYSSLITLNATFDGYYANVRFGKLPTNDNEVLISLAMAKRILGKTLSVHTAIGKQIEIAVDKQGDITGVFEVCGIINDETKFDFAVITHPALNALFIEGAAPVNKVYVLAEDITWVPKLVTDLNFLTFVAVRQDTSIEELLSYVDVGTATLIAVSAISLVVSAIMIFIVMYIGVSERTKEIGILRAVGARKRDVRIIFLFEAAIIGLIAGFFGGAFSYILGLLVNLVMGGIFISVNPLFPLLGIIISAAVSAASGASPANRAANADPVESLRAE